MRERERKRQRGRDGEREEEGTRERKKGEREKDVGKTGRLGRREERGGYSPVGRWMEVFSEGIPGQDLGGWFSRVTPGEMKRGYATSKL